MNIVTGILVYVIIWWVTIFTILPFGVQTEDKPKIGMAWGHPKKARLRRAFMLTTLVSTVLWAIIYAVTSYTNFSFRWDPDDGAFYGQREK